MLTAFSNLSASGGGNTIVGITVLSNLSLKGRKMYVHYCFVITVSIVVMLITKMLYK